MLLLHLQLNSFASHKLQEKGEYENTLIATFPFFFAAFANHG
jgi:hypothetical protein